MRALLASPLSQSDAGLALIDDEVEGWRRLVADRGREQGMGLAAVMGLVVEEVVERKGERLLDILRTHEGAIADRGGQIRLVERVDIVGDTPVLRDAGGPQGREVVMQNGVEALRQFSLAGETGHPQAVSHQEVVERPVQRPEI